MIMTTQHTPTPFEIAKDWYLNLATSLNVAGVKIRLFNDYPTVEDEKEAFVLAVQDERAGKPLPANKAALHLARGEG